MSDRNTKFAAYQLLTGQLHGWLHDMTDHDDDTGCMLWCHGCGSSGSVPMMQRPAALPPMPRRHQKTVNVRRAVWEESRHQPVPEGHRVYSTCTQRLCIAPRHLACKPLSEVASILSIRSTASRQSLTARKKMAASARRRSPLTDEDVAEIRAVIAGMPEKAAPGEPGRMAMYRSYAERFGVTVKTIQHIAINRQRIAMLDATNPFSQMLLHGERMAA